MAKGSLSVVLCFTNISKIEGSQPPYYPPYPPPQQHQHNWTAGAPIPKPIVMLFYPGTTYTATHLRCYEIAWLANVASATDWDQCTASGCPFPNGWAADQIVRVRWSDNGAGGQFGTLDSNGNFVPLDPELNAEQITHYRAPWDNPGIVHITLEVEDAGIYYKDTDEPVSNDADNGNVTVWEFWITPCPQNWRPIPNTTGPSFIAWVEPEVDHLGQPMSGIITFNLISSTEPGECLNSHFSCPYDVDIIAGIEVNDIHDNDADLQFPPDLEGMHVYGMQEEDEEGPYEHNFTVAVTQQPTTMAAVSILCFDGGAYGFLLAHIDGFPPGSAMARRTDTGLVDPVEIPYDENGNFIADMWEQNLEIYPADPLGDFDNSPVGDGTPGDGLSVYEEYRGLRVRGIWTVFNPWIKDMFVMNFGAGNEDPYEPAVIPNDAITSPDGFIGAGMPPLWLLNANEGLGYPLRVVNFLWNYAHRRDVYAAVIVPGDIEGYQDANRDGQPDDVNDDGVIDDNDLVVDVDAYGFTYGPIWDEAGGPIAPPGDWGYIPQFWGPPVIEVDVDLIRQHQQNPQQNPNGLTELQALTWIVGHELGHTVLWHQPAYGHHEGNTTFDCLIWRWMDWRPNPPTEFCVVNPGCQTRWKVNP